MPVRWPAPTALLLLLVHNVQQRTISAAPIVYLAYPTAMYAATAQNARLVVLTFHYLLPICVLLAICLVPLARQMAVAQLVPLDIIWIVDNV